MKRRYLAPVLVGLLAFAACGDDDGADVRSLGGDECASGSSSASGASAEASASGASASGCASASASASAASADGGEASASAAPAAGECEVIGGVDAPADSEGDVTLDEWSVEVEEADLVAGNVRLAATNAGEDAHELVVVRGATADLPIVDGVVDEEGLAEGDLIGEIEPFTGECEGTFELTAGTYTVFCAIVEEAEDGTVENHYELGMVNEVEVS